MKFFVCRWIQVVLMVVTTAYLVNRDLNKAFASYYRPYSHNGACYNSSDLPNTQVCPCGKICINKCCDIGEVFDSRDSLMCVKHANDSFLYNLKVFYNLRLGQEVPELRSNPLQPEDIVVVPQVIHSLWSAIINIEESTYLLESGLVMTAKLVYLAPSEMCLETVRGMSGTVTVRQLNTPTHYPPVNILRVTCFKLLLTALSVVLLLVTFYVYLTQPELLNLHGKMSVCYLSCHVLFYFSATFFNVPFLNRYIIEGLCTLLNFAILGLGAWLTAMSLDIWGVFCQPLKPPDQSKPGNFLLYSVICWGYPLVTCVLVSAVGIVPFTSDSCPKPRFEDDDCFFSNKRFHDLLDLHVDVTAVLNAFMCLSTLVNLEVLHSRGLFRRHSDGYLYLKLPFIMGANWLLIWLGFKTNSLKTFLFLQNVVSVQGVFLSVALLWNDRVFKALRRTLCSP